MARARAEGYWYICELTELDVSGPTTFEGTITVKKELGGTVVTFDQNARAYEIANRRTGGVGDAGRCAD